MKHFLMIYMNQLAQLVPLNPRKSQEIKRLIKEKLGFDL